MQRSEELEPTGLPVRGCLTGALPPPPLWVGATGVLRGASTPDAEACPPLSGCL